MAASGSTPTRYGDNCCNTFIDPDRLLPAPMLSTMDRSGHSLAAQRTRWPTERRGGTITFTVVIIAAGLLKRFCDSTSVTVAFLAGPIQASCLLGRLEGAPPYLHH